MTTWIRGPYPQFTKFCCVNEQRSKDSDSFITYCNGSYPKNVAYESATDPGKSGCAACRTIVGLLELRGALVVETVELPIAPFEHCGGQG